MERQLVKPIYSLVSISEVACTAHINLLNHFKNSTRMEAMVFVTWGRFLHLPSSSGYATFLKCIYYSWSSSYQTVFLFNCFLYVWCYKALQGQTLWIMLTFWFYCWLGYLLCVTSHSSPNTALISNKHTMLTLQLLVSHMILMLYVCYVLATKTIIIQY